MKYLPLVLLLAAFGSAQAEKYHFQVLVSSTTNAENLGAALSLLEKTGEDSSTLCALYILKEQYIKAAPVCDDAVKGTGSQAAYNNRGVLRIHLNDLAGALQDFERAGALKPHELNRHTQNIINGDPRIIATSNLSNAQRLQEKRNVVKIDLPTADPEGVQ